MPSCSSASAPPDPSKSPSELSREQKLEMLALLEETQRRRLEAPLLFYRPASPKHARLHDSGARRKVLNGGNKSGKTYWTVAHALAHACGYFFWKVPDLRLDATTGFLPPRDVIDPQYWVLNGAGAPLKLPNAGVLVTGLQRQQGIGEIIWPVFEELLPPATKAHPEYSVVKVQGVPIKLRLPGGSTISFLSAEQDEISFEGTLLQWAGIDEPVKPFVYNGLWRGLAIDSGPVWFTLTPLTARCTWIYNSIVKPRHTDVLCINVRQEDNPYFSEEARRAFASNTSWTDAEKKARLYGEWEALGSRVIHNWDSAVHVVPARALPPDWVRGHVVDPHHVRPAACLWYAISPAGVYHFYREWPTEPFVGLTSGGKTPTEYAILFRNIEGARPPHFRVADPRFGKAEGNYHGIAMTSWADQMAECGMPFDTRVPGVGRVEIGEQKIIELLRYDRSHPISPTNMPKILVHDVCENLIAAFENYGLVGDRDPTKGVTEKRSEEYKDFIDCVRYSILYGQPVTEIDVDAPNYIEDALSKENADDW